MATTTLNPAAPAYRSGLYEWLTTTDHKKIGIMYLVNSILFFVTARRAVTSFFLFNSFLSLTLSASYRPTTKVH